jgi:AcrR family transcriptional regulator
VSVLQPNDTRAVILTEARAVIDERGEAGLRVAELAERCGVAVGLLYHYFKDRQALIAAVRAQQFAELVDADIDTVDMNIADATTVEGLLEASVANFGANIDDEQRRANRWGRLAILAAAEHNEVLRNEISAQQVRSSRALIDVIEKAQAQGLVRTDISAKAIALLVEAVPLGTVLADINPETAPSQEEWLALITELLLTFGPR